ncbi:MAG: 3-methylcrotonyl-CoA carboxylase, partial [Beijerinckiaceae bacterium]|nr:3-methylcrotonyl-CoA carboxylase [Beijerinckiaceae bacterium]
AGELASAKREALSAFGDDRVIVEKYFARARHVEVQIFADAQGNLVHLFDRDCSIQRRYQKIIEEAPAPQIPGLTRQAMRMAALEAARAAGYTGAGTVEFLFSPADGNFYFLEMNTRLQVEHPVTEMITGIDLVEWQIRIAAGEPLPRRQEAISARGHAIEARIYAEDPARGFLPQSGHVLHLSFPEVLPHVRIDTGVRGGDVIPLDYDPMIAKLIVWDEDRGMAIQRLRAALREVRLAGLGTNLGLLRAIAANESFRGGPLDTGFVERHLAGLLPANDPAGAEALVLAAIGLLCERAAREGAKRSSDPWSPWSRQNGWRLNKVAREPLVVRKLSAGSEKDCPIGVTYLNDGWRLDLHEAMAVHARGTLGKDGNLAAELDGRKAKAIWVLSGQEIFVLTGEAEAHRFELLSSAAVVPASGRPSGQLTSPMPGRITAILVEPGALVVANQPILVLEAMKMEHLLRAPQDGVLKSLNCKLGEQVTEGAGLAQIEPARPEFAP